MVRFYAIIIFLHFGAAAIAQPFSIEQVQKNLMHYKLGRHDV
jgi:hypothetical protein